MFVLTLAPGAGAAPVAAPTSAEPPPATRVPPRHARPLADYTLVRTPERRARGEYLVEGLLQCFICHSPRDWDAPGAPPVAGMKGAGHVLRDDGKRRLVAPNLTPDKETGAGTWSDDMLARAIREGVGHDGRPLHPYMRYRTFSVMSDEDLAAVIVYLRSIPGVRNPLPSTVLSDEASAEITAALYPIMEPVAERDSSNPLARGRYLLALADCAGCHTAWEAPRMPGLFGGGNEIEFDGRTAFSANLTPDPTGMSYDAATFIAVMRTGKGGTLSGVMPWVAFQSLSDEDMTAMHAVLRTVAPVAHRIDNHSLAQLCVVCGQEHGLGELNRLQAPPPGIEVDPALYDAYAGRYYNAQFDVTVTIARSGERLTLQEDDGETIQLIPQSETHFLAPGAVGPVSFERDAGGHVVRLLSHELEDLPFERQDPAPAVTPH